MGHEIQDAISLELGRRTAHGLLQHPEWINVARANLDRWSRMNADAPSLLHCYNEWRELLSRPLSEICSLLIAQTDEGQRLRQSSPFAGVLPPREVWEIKQRIQSHATSAT